MHNNRINLELYLNSYSLFEYISDNIHNIDSHYLLNNQLIIEKYKTLSNDEKKLLNKNNITQKFFSKLQSILDYQSISFISIDPAYSNISDPKLNDNQLNLDLENFSYSQLVIAFYYDYKPYIIEHGNKCKPFNLFQNIFLHRSIFNIFLLLNNKYITEEYLKLTLEEKEELANYEDINKLFNEIQLILNIENF